MSHYKGRGHSLEREPERRRPREPDGRRGWVSTTPRVRAEAVDISPEASYADGVSAVARASLPLHAFLCTRLAA